MILLTSLLHSETLREIIFRWMTDDLRQEDCVSIKKIINFNVYAINLYLDELCRRLFPAITGEDCWSFEVNLKGQLRDFILKVAPYRNERLEEIEYRYRRYPEDFYKTSPFHAKVYCSGSQEMPAYVGHSRIKRFRRVAEKASRRMISLIFNQVKQRADRLAEERASRLGIPKDQLITPLDQQIEEFKHAERRFLKELRNGLFRPDRRMIEEASIHDVAGVKVIVDDDKAAALEQFFSETPELRVVEKEVHKGNYNAINYIIELRLDKEKLIARPPSERAVEVLVARGMERATLGRSYVEFVESAQDCVFLEVIASSYPEMVESEFGRCIHEERIQAQREQVEYRSSIARNVRYITEYLFLFAISYKSYIQRLPIRLWEKVLPDTYDHAIRELWDIPTMPVI